MEIRLLILFSLLAALAPVASGAADDASMASESIVAIDTASDVIESDLPKDVTISKSNLSSEINVQGIWRLSLEEMDITMALSQSNSSLFGQAKNEADNLWNGLAVGLLVGNRSSISLSAMVGEILVSTLLEGNADGDIIKGDYIQYDGSKKYRGKFTAIMINPDVSAYEQATVELPLDDAQSGNVVEDAADEETVEPAAQSTNSRFKSVTDLAKGINPNIMPRMATI